MEEMRGMLQKHGFNMPQACDYIELKTGSVFTPQKVWKQLYDTGTLDEKTNAAFRFMDRLKDAGKDQRSAAG